MGSAPILASAVSVGVGAAWGMAMDQRPDVVIVYFGDGATEEGTFHEAMNFAGVRRLPVIFVCENNLYSVHSTLDVRQPDRPLTALGTAHGMEAAHGATATMPTQFTGWRAKPSRARGVAGKAFWNSPRLIAGWSIAAPNDDIALGYRSAEELADWKLRDPVESLRAKLLATRELTLEQDDALRARIDHEIRDAFDEVRASPFPSTSEMMTHVFPGPRAA